MTNIIKEITPETTNNPNAVVIAFEDDLLSHGFLISSKKIIMDKPTARINKNEEATIMIILTTRKILLLENR